MSPQFCPTTSLDAYSSFDDLSSEQIMRLIAPLGVATTLAFTVPCLAASQNVGPELRQEAYDNCMSDALRLCPQSLSDEGQVVSCMATKRPQLSQTCRITYDKVARVLND